MIDNLRKKYEKKVVFLPEGNGITLLGTATRVLGILDMYDLFDDFKKIIAKYEEKIEKLRNELKENEQISDSISGFIRERDEARKEIQRIHKVLGYQTWMLKHRLDKIHKLKDDRKALNDRVINLRKEIGYIRDWGYGGIVFYNNEFPRFTEVVELKDLKKWAREMNKGMRK